MIRRAAAAGEDADIGHRPDAELLGGVLVEEDLTAAAADAASATFAVRADDRAEAGHARGVGREQRHPRLGLPLQPEPATATCSMMAGVTPSTRSVPASAASISSTTRLVEVLDPGRRAEPRAEADLGAARRDELVGLTERRHSGATNRVAHRVAGREGRRDDRRAEHQPDHDERRPAAPASDVANAELDQDRMPQRQHADDPERDGERDSEDDEERVDRDAEELLSSHGVRELALEALDDLAVEHVHDAVGLLADGDVVGDDQERQPALELSRRMRSTISSALSLSRSPVGSSAQTIAGSFTSARAIVTRWRWPPESSSGR